MSPRCSDARWGGSRVRRETPTRQKLRDGMLTAHVGHGHGTAWHSPSPTWQNARCLVAASALQGAGHLRPPVASARGGSVE